MVYLFLFLIDATCNGRENSIVPIEHSVDNSSNNSSPVVEKINKPIAKKNRLTQRSDKSVQINTLAPQIRKSVDKKSEITDVDVCFIF